jgi:hypothetical protein
MLVNLSFYIEIDFVVFMCRFRENSQWDKMIQSTSVLPSSQVSFNAPSSGVAATTKQIASFVSNLFNWDGLNIGRGVLSLLRYGGLTIASTLPLGKIGMGASALGVIVQGKQLTDDFSSIQQAREIGDTEGVALRAVKIGEEGVMTMCSTFSLAGLVLEEAPSLFSANGPTFTAAMGSVFTVVGSVLLGVGSVVGMGLSGMRLYQLGRFGASLRELSYDPKAPDAEGRARLALENLSKLFTITEEDQKKIRGEIAHLGSEISSEDANELFSRKLLDLTQVKIQAIKRRSSMKSVELLTVQVPDLLARLKVSKTREGAIQETAALIETLRAENRKKTLLFATAFIVALIAFGAFLAGSILSGGVIPFALLFVATAVTMISFAIHNYLIYKANKPVNKIV